MSKERPIIFSAELVRAILDGRKNVTRRIVDSKFNPANWDFDPKDRSYGPFMEDRYGEHHNVLDLCPYQPGDILYVREMWADLRGMGFDKPFAYLADSLNQHGVEDGDSKRCRLDYGVKWKPSIHMPREAARLFLRVKNVRVERLQDITEDDCWREGISEAEARKRPYIDKYGVGCAMAVFSNLWDRYNAKRGYGWAVNPWVFVIEFEVEKEVGRDAYMGG